MVVRLFVKILKSNSFVKMQKNLKFGKIDEINKHKILTLFIANVHTMLKGRQDKKYYFYNRNYFFHKMRFKDEITKIYFEQIRK